MSALAKRREPVSHACMTRSTVLLLGLLLAWRGAVAENRTHGAIATGHPLATAAGVNALQHGGNAVDAAIAAAITLGVVDGHNSGLGGGCFILIRTADGALTAIDGREKAPALATRDMFVRDGKVDTAASRTGALASATPGALAAYQLALRKHGKLKLADLLLPAADIAAGGFPLDEVYANKLTAMADRLRKAEECRKFFFDADGTPLKKGDTLKQPDLARSLRAIAGQGTDWFYRGDYADKADAWMRANGGVLRKDDFANYAAVLREPLRTHYRGHEIIGMPPVSSGGVLVAQILNILETFDIAAMPTADRLHVTAEAMKLAFADRAYWLGDPDFVKVPRGLTDRDYAQQLAARIRPDRASTVSGHGAPPRWDGDVFGKHTTHLSAADAEGNWVALTQTINTAFGSMVIVPGTGIFLNDEMDDFAVAPGVPNAFKLVGAEANAVEPNKRPLSSMSPTLVLKDGKPILSVGAAGGPTIISQTVQALVNVIDLKMDIAGALKQPRIHHQWSPDELKIETGAGAEVMRELTARGHTLDPTSSFGACQAVLWDEASHGFQAAHDPRVPGSASGW